VTGNKEELVARLTGGAPPPKKTKTSAQLAGVSPHLLELLDVAKLKSELKRRVKVLAQMVDADWCARARTGRPRASPKQSTCSVVVLVCGARCAALWGAYESNHRRCRHDGYEEQGEELCSYVSGLEPHLHAVLTLCTTSPPPPGAAFARANDVLVEIAESWRDMAGVPFRCCMEEAISEAKLDMSGFDDDGAEPAEDEEDEDEDEKGELSRADAVAVAWRTLLRAASSSAGCDDATLLRCVKDASDYDITSLAPAHPPAGFFTPWSTAAGYARLQAALGADGRAARDALPSRLRVHKAYRAIDRRFDGPKHQCTRDFSHMFDY
jgi:hypothetical protein